MDALTWVMHNKSWLFSGAGVVVITTIGTFMLWMIKKKNVQNQLKIEAVAKFRSAFAEAITQLTKGSIDPHYLICQYNNMVQHDNAIFEFLRFVEKGHLSDFNIAEENFQKCRNALKPAFLLVIQSEVTGEPIDQFGVYNVIGAINRLLAFANKARI